MSKTKVLVQSPHTIFDGKGHPMSHGYVYSIDADETLRSFLEEGLVTVVADATPETEEKKNTPPKVAKPQETETI